MYKFTQLPFSVFSEQLASSAPVPGGGGAAAMTGALGASLGCMVCSLTIGKKKYADVEENVKGSLKKLDALRTRLCQLVDEDAESFKKLEECWALPKDYPSRDDIMEAALIAACDVPIETIYVSAQTIKLLAELAEIGNKTAISDIGVGLELCAAAIRGSKQNININASLMKDRTSSARLLSDYSAIENEYLPLADKALAKVAERIG